MKWMPLLAPILCSAMCLAQQPIQNGLKLDDISVHDPWILADQPSHTYYLYTSSRPSLSSSHRSGVITYKSTDLKTWSGPYVVFEVPDGSWGNPSDGVWAPEVHFYKGKYYLFATVNNYSKTLPAVGGKSSDPAKGAHIQAPIMASALTCGVPRCSSARNPTALSRRSSTSRSLPLTT